jgi:hypothetical protein
VCTDDTKPEDRPRVDDDHRNGRHQPKACTGDTQCSSGKTCVNYVCTDDTKPEDKPKGDDAPKVEDKPKGDDAPKVDDAPKFEDKPKVAAADVAAVDG